MRMRLPNGYGSITKMSGRRRNKWRVFAPCTYDSEGADVRKTLGYFPTREEALKCLADYHANPNAYLSEKVTFETLYNKWFESHKDKVTEGTVKGYKACYLHFSSILNKPVDEINLSTLQPIINESTDGMKKALKKVLMMIFDYGIKIDIISKNYAKYIEIGNLETVINRQAYSDEEINILWKNYDNRASKYLLMLIYSGMRINELVNMKRENVYLAEDYMIGGSKTKAGRNRIIPIHKFTKPIIEDFYNQNNELLINYKRSISAIGHSIREFTKELNMDHTTHDTRYTFASLMERAGVPLLTTQKIIGHSAGNLTQDLYTQIHATDLVEAVNKITVR